jgi:hypothetical protein
MGILCFSDILRKVNIDPEKVKLIRHALTDKGFKQCYDKHMVYEYTCHQKTSFSNGYDYWAVFISDAGTLAKFYALYQVDSFVPDTSDRVPVNLPEREARGYNGKGALFQLQRVDTLQEYEEKLTIDWGKSTRMWHQRGTTEKPVISIQPDRKRVFCGYEDLVLSYDELQEIVTNQEVYDAWHTALSSIYAVYLIVDKESGKQYVGSAYGEGGLLGRWKCYVDTFHGGNKRMKALLDDAPDRYRQFQFSILQILPKTLTEESVVEIESLYKKKLMSIEFGLNDN